MDKIKFTSRQLAQIINEKYRGAKIRLLNETDEAYIYLIHGMSALDKDPVMLIYYTDPAIPFWHSFDFFTKNKYFQVPI